MRPLELTMEGFKSYAEEQALTFDGRSLFAIVGPTGAGKSTILEAIMYALYGKTHREGRETKDLIRTGADSARVRLSFEVDTGPWEVTRVLRRRGASQAVLTRLGDQHPEATGQTAVTARIEDLLGLDFAAFCSSVVLPQGKFDRFLMATPSERSRILKGIFRLERVDAIRERAKKRVTELGAEASGLRGELRALPADPGRLEELRARKAEAQARADAIRREVAAVAAAEQTLEHSRARLDDLRRRGEDIDRALARVPVARRLDALAAEEAAQRRAVEAAADAAVVARQAQGDACAALEAARRETGGREVLGRVREQDAVRRRLGAELTTLEADRRRLAEEIEAAAAHDGHCAGEASRDAAAVAEAEQALRRLERRHSAHVLRAGLEPGGPCPVCEQRVDAVPPLEAPEALEAAEGLLAAARAAAQESATRHERAREALVTGTERARSTDRAIDRIRGDLEHAQRVLDGLLGGAEDPSTELARREALLEAAAAREEHARRDAAAAEADLARASAAAQEAAKRRRAAAATLVELSATLGFPAPDIEGDAGRLRAAADAATEAGTGLREATAAAMDGLRKEVEDAAGRVRQFRERFGLDAQASAGDALEQSMRRVGSVQREIEAVEQAIERAAELEKTIEGIEAGRSLYERLALDMTDHKFTAYLLDAERRLLAQLGSEKLYELTAGRYRFDEEGTFEIVEARSDGKRAADTLSGGETFLASLALALALAEAVSQTGGRLGCFFLDEGFGSLDSESLALALEGIESLATPGRLIGLISHVGGLQSELDDLIVLDKADDGRTIVVQAEGPLSYPAALI